MSTFVPDSIAEEQGEHVDVVTLPADAADAVDALSAMLEALAAQPKLAIGAFAARVLRIDEAAQPALRRLIREPLGADAAPGIAARARACGLRFLELDGAALQAILDAPERGVRGVSPLKPLLPAIALRAVRTAALHLKWLATQYGPAQTAPWRRAAFAWRLAERLKVTTSTLRPYAELPHESSIRDEFVRMVAFAASSPGSLPVAHIEALDRLLALVAPRLTLERKPAKGTHYWIDIDRPKAPSRHIRALDPRGGLRFVGGLAILPALAGIAAAATHDAELPASLGLEGLCDSHDVLAVIAHLASHWAPKVPVRRHPHRAIRSAVAVVTGFDDVLDTLVARDAAATGRLARSPLAQRWTTDNVSPGGLAAYAPAEAASQVRVGEMVAVRAEHGVEWQVGMVRRLERISERGLFVAVELLQGQVRPVEVVVESRGRRVASSPGAAAGGVEVAILATATADNVHEAFLVLRAGAHVTGQQYAPEEPFRGTLLLPEGMLRRGADHELVRCRVIAR